jgi:tRNA A-37 threonylcarbamoyl transferase component Bud32
MRPAVGTPDELAGFIDQVSRGGAGLVRFDACGGCGFAAASVASEANIRELTKAAIRPPAGLTICKFGSRSVVGTFRLPAGESVFKYYYPRSWHKRLTYGVAGSRAHQSWVAGLALTHVGIATAEPLVLVEWRTAGCLLDRSFLAARHVAGVSLLTFVEEHANDSARLNAVACRLREAFTTMARHRIAHGDLKASNIIVGAGDSVTFIDLDATTLLSTPARWRTLRERDIRLFFGNWASNSPVRSIFRDVFIPG